MTWRNGLFVHYPVEPASLRPHLPDRLELDTWDGQAWISVLPFVLAASGFRYSPSIARVTVPEVNLRTYVRLEGASGLYFFSIDLENAPIAALVRRLYGLPCYRAEMRLAANRGRFAFSSRGDRPDAPPARLDVTYAPTGDAFRADPASLDRWLVERRRFYAPSEEGVLYGEIAHEPWPLQPVDVTIRENTLFEAAGIPRPERDPICYYSEALPMTGSILRRLDADGTDDDWRNRIDALRPNPSLPRSPG